MQDRNTLHTISEVDTCQVNASAGWSMQKFLTLQFVGPQMTSSTTRRWNKDVDRSLYGSREYASKNPALSPITERLSFISQSPTAQETPSISCKGKKKEKKVASV